MTPAGVLEEIRRRGAIAYRAGDTIRLRPASVLPPELIDAVRQHKTELLPLVPTANADAPSTGAWRVVVDRDEPAPGPIRLNAWTTIVDPTKCIAASRADLELAVAARNAGRERSSLVALIDERIATLAACGCVARVIGPVQ